MRASPRTTANQTSVLGCDIGGTFTDFVLVDGQGTLRVEKVLTTPRAPWEAVVAGIRALRAAAPDFGEIGRMIHATTLVSNAVIERRGAPTGLITTAGFRDVLELRRHMRTSVFEISQDPAAPLVDRSLRFEVEGRVFSDGEVIAPLAEDQVREAARALAALGVKSIAIVFIHSYANDSHERRAREIVREEAPDIDVSISSEVLPLIGEFPRTSTTVINAYAMPLVRRYMGRLAEETGALGVRTIYVMTSDGGLTDVQTATEFPARIIESGPVAGVIGARTVAEGLGLKKYVSFDMGGTTAKVCLASGGQLPLTMDLEVARTHRFRKGSGHPVGTPSVDLIEIGAGGGSIASINSLGLIQAGPESSGAEPGPACYARGGTKPTVTDADLVLGYLSSDSFLGGRMHLDSEAARRAIETDIAKPLGISIEDAAWRIHDVTNEMMAGVVRRQMVEKGSAEDMDTLIAFGGAGPVHATNMASKLGLRTVVIPVRAGVASAVGLTEAPIAFHVVQAKKTPLASIDGRLLHDAFAPLDQEAVRRVRRAAEGEVCIERALDVRYRGQGFELRIPLVVESVTSLSADDLKRLFLDAYRARFGYFYDDLVEELINLHVTAWTPQRSAGVGAAAAPKPTAAGRKRERPAWDGIAGGYVPHAVVARHDLRTGDIVEGPAVIEESESTTVIGSGTRATLHASGSLVINTGAEK